MRDAERLVYVYIYFLCLSLKLAATVHTAKAAKLANKSTVFDSS